MSLQDMLPKYVGGQLEVQDQKEKYLRRGEIKEIEINDDNLEIRLAWNSNAIGCLSFPTGWALDSDPSRLDYSFNLGAYNHSTDEIGRTMMASKETNETVTIYPIGSNAKIPKPTE